VSDKVIPTDVPGTLPGPRTATEAVDKLDAIKGLPPFLNEQVRHREAYLTLIKDLTGHLAEDWSSKPEALAKARVNEAIARSLEMWI